VGHRKERVVASKEEMTQVKKSVPKGMSLVGFVSNKEIKEWFNVKPA